VAFARNSSIGSGLIPGRLPVPQGGVAMKRRIIGLGMALISACSFLTGCSSLGHGAKSKPSEDSIADKVDSVKQDPAASGFFKNSRLSGAMSSEGRDIERDLGVQ
jgi:hypothetical protein